MTRKYPRVQLEFKKPSLTKQAPAAATKIENIIQQFRVTGLMPESKGEPVYGDASESNYFEDQLRMAGVKSQFEALPDAEKARLGTPAALLKEQIAAYKAEERLVRGETEPDQGVTQGSEQKEPEQNSEALESRSNSKTQESPEGESS